MSTYNKKQVIDICDELICLQYAYYSTLRRSPSPYRTEALLELDIETEELQRESLMEHVGHLPIIACFLHPYLEHTIDLGKVLIMLSIHDIGETILGDVFVLDKTDEEEAQEMEAALTLLSGEQNEIFLEFEKQESLEAKFAWCIDKLAPKLIEITMPARTDMRLNEIGRAIEDFTVHERERYDWSPFLATVYDTLIEQYINQREGNKLLFDVSKYDK